MAPKKKNPYCHFKLKALLSNKTQVLVIIDIKYFCGNSFK